MVYDTAIIGAGPAGVSAALNLKILGKSFIWFGSRELSAKVGKAELVRNYPGLPNVTGAQLREAYLRHLDAMGIEITEQMVNSVSRMRRGFAVMADNDFYEAKTLILTTGAANTKTLPGESELLGRGVSYCATCDGELYRGRRIAIVLGSRRFGHEADYLSGLSGSAVLFAGYKDCGADLTNVTMLGVTPAAILGEERVTGVRTASGDVIPVDGVFILRESVALSTLLPGLETEDGHIAVDRAMATNLPGVFAAGDCTGRPYQYAKAVGEGNVAAHSVVEYLADKS